MSTTGTSNRLQILRDENSTNINPAKNQPINQAPKSALKDLTNASKKLNILGGKPGTSFRTPQIQGKKDSKVKEKEELKIYMDDFCTSLTKDSHKFPEYNNWIPFDSDKIVKKLSKPISDCIGYEIFKDDEFVLAPLPKPDPIDPFESGNLPKDDWKSAIDDFVMEPMKIDDVPDLDFTDFTFDM